MNIFLITHPSGNISIPGSNTWIYNLYEPLLDLGHQVYFINLADFCSKNRVRFRSRKYRDILNSKLYDWVRSEHKKNGVDLFFGYLTNLDIDPEIIVSIKELGIPAVNFSCNNTHQFHLVESISSAFTYCLHSEKNTSDKFRKAGANPVWFQMSANPKYYHPRNLSKIYDVTFAGMNYARRAHYIEQLILKGIEIYCFGPKWSLGENPERFRKEIKRKLFLLKSFVSSNYSSRSKYSTWIADYDSRNRLASKYNHLFLPSLSDREMVDLYSKSRINLGFLEVYEKDPEGNIITGQHLHLREFEIPMSGGLYCTNFSDELSEHYVPDKELIVFRNEHELFDKISYYLRNPDEADKIRQAGYRRAVSDHTCQIRLKNLLRDLAI